MVEALTNESNKMSFRLGSIKDSNECKRPVRIILFIHNDTFQFSIIECFNMEFYCN